MQPFYWTEMIGGLAFFFIGLQAIKEALQLMAGTKIKSTLGKLTTNRFMALFTGVLITFFLQSSSATTVLLVSLAGTQYLNLNQAFGVILGADIGTTFVVILLSIKKITEYSLLIIAFGFALKILAKRTKTKHIGSVFLGFGLVFFGMNLMSHAAEPLRTHPMAMQAFQYMAMHPFVNLIIATIFTAIVQASAATIGMAISLSFAGLINFEAAIPIVLGANLGTCITAFLGSFGMGTEGRRVAVAHTIVKLTGVAIAFPFIPQIANSIDYLVRDIIEFIPDIDPGVAGKIAIVHLLFNIAIALCFLPFIKWGVLLVEKLVPKPESKEKPFGPRYLDENVLDTPLIAFAQAKREIIRVAGYTFDLFKDSINMFHKNNLNQQDIIEKIETRDDKIDILEKAIRFYLAKLSQKMLSADQAKSQYILLNIADNLEEIGDIISKELVSLAKKKVTKNAVFSDEGWKQLTHFHEMVVSNFNLTISAIASPYPEVIQKIMRHQKVVYDLEQEYKQDHLNRLYKGLKETLETSSIHMDLLSNFRRVNGQLTYIAKIIAEMHHEEED